MRPIDRTHLTRILLVVVAAKAGSSDADIAAAASLDLCRPMRSVNGRRVTSVGASRHPRFGDSIITTSPPVAFGAQAGLARSSSGFHQLGTDLGEVEKDPAVPVGSISFDWLALIPMGDPEPPARTDIIRRAGTMPMPRPG